MIWARAHMGSETSPSIVGASEGSIFVALAVGIYVLKSRTGSSRVAGASAPNASLAKRSKPAVATLDLSAAARERPRCAAQCVGELIIPPAIDLLFCFCF